MVLQRLRATQVAITLPYRCDVPDFRLYMEAELIPLADGQVEITSRSVRSESRDLRELAPVIHGAEELLRICSWCKRIRMGEWEQPELAIKWLRLLERPRLPELSHGICETNPLESIFGGVRLRTDATKRMRRRDNALYLVFKIVERLGENWRVLNGGANLMALVLAGCVFKDGILQRQEVLQVATAAD